MGPQMTSIRTGLAVDLLVEASDFFCVLYSSVQKMKHTVGGISRGRNTVSDCCMKKAITPMNPRTNPMALASGRAPFSSFWFCNIMPIGIEGVYMAVYFFPGPKAEKTVTETK